MTMLVRESWSPPFWRKTAATSTTAAVISIPEGARILKVWVDVASLIAVGTTVTAPATSATNAVHTIRSKGTPTGGTFKLKFRGQTTSALTFDESAADIDAALEALSTIGTGGVVSAGGDLPTAVTVTWSGTPFAGIPVERLEVVEAALTGGTNPEIYVVGTTAGDNPYGYLEANTQEVLAIDPNAYEFLYIAAVTGTGNYRLSAYR